MVLAALAGGAPAAEPAWKVGLAQIKVTPERPVPMSGYAGRTRPFEKVAADLYVKALVLADSKGQRGVIVTSDLLGFPAAVAEPICERIEKKTGLKRAQILLNSSHTHAGPALSLTPPRKGDRGAASGVSGSALWGCRGKPSADEQRIAASFSAARTARHPSRGTGTAR
jgi:hypothetical protein